MKPKPADIKRVLCLLDNFSALTTALDAAVARQDISLDLMIRARQLVSMVKPLIDQAKKEGWGK